LPSGSSVMFREPGVWEQYRWQIVTTVAALLLQAALISSLVYQRRRARLAEAQSQQSFAELAHLSRHATANEFGTSIAHEINQPLAAILTNSEAAMLLLDRKPLDVDELRQIITDIHRDDQR